ncbi:MAG: hypothetical protein IT427_14345 [Pirellulales bacterium]|nr:hypothetical protein [Pirellulales bacterium]
MKQFTVVVTMLWGLSAEASGDGIVWPGLEPGPAKMQREAESVVLSNRLLSASWDGNTAPRFDFDKAAAKLVDKPNEPFTLHLTDHRALKASAFRRDGALEVSRIEPVPGSVKAASRFGGWQATARLVSADGQISVRWQLVLRDAANYIQQVLSVSGRNPLNVRQLLIDGSLLPQARVMGTALGSPVVADHLFFVCEHPMAEHEVQDDHVTVFLRRYQPIESEKPWTVTWTTGVAPEGQMRRAFLYYVERERARPYHPLCYYISWFDIAGYGAAGQKLQMHEKQCLDVIDAIGREMSAKRGVPLDAFVFDDGWDDPTTLWQFHNGFPDGFAPLQKAAAKHGAFLGTWLSPFGGYREAKTTRVKYGREHGYETNAEGFSLAGPKYYRAFFEACARQMRDYGVNYLKFDGIGNLSSVGSDAFAPDMEALVQLLDDLRQVHADVFLNTTAGTWPSPFWLWHSDAVFRGGYDVSWCGLGTNRQRWLTYRDGVGFQIRTKRGPLFPFNSLKFQGVICAKLEGLVIEHGAQGTQILDAPPFGQEPKDLIDDIRMAAGSGTQIQEFFITSSMIAPEVWDAMAETIAWMRRNADVLVDSHGIGGDPLRGEPYGYASWSPRMGILALRNPSDKTQTLEVDFQRAFELPDGSPTRYVLSSPWRKTAINAPPPLDGVAGAGAVAHYTFQLAPCEVLVVEARPAKGH